MMLMCLRCRCSSTAIAPISSSSCRSLCLRIQCPTRRRTVSIICNRDIYLRFASSIPNQPSNCAAFDFMFAFYSQLIMFSVDYHEICRICKSHTIAALSEPSAIAPSGDATAISLLENPIATTTNLLRVLGNCKLAQIINCILRMSIRVICHRAHSVPLVVSLRTIYQLEIYDSSQQTEPQQPASDCMPQYGTNK